MIPDSPCEGSLGTVIDVQDAVFAHERVVLLLVKGHTGGQRRDVPMQMRVALTAAQAEAVHPLGRHDRSRRNRSSLHGIRNVAPRTAQRDLLGAHRWARGRVGKPGWPSRRLRCGNKSAARASVKDEPETTGIREW